MLTAGVDPRRPARRRPSRRIRAAVAVLYRDLTVAEHIDPAATLRDGFDRAMAARYVERLAIRTGARAGELSGGEGPRSGWRWPSPRGRRSFSSTSRWPPLDPLARREFLHLMVEAVRRPEPRPCCRPRDRTDIGQACDRLIVLGRGHTLLDLPIAEALAHHQVVEGRPSAGAITLRRRGHRLVPGAGQDAADARPDAGRRGRRGTRRSPGDALERSSSATWLPGRTGRRRPQSRTREPRHDGPRVPAVVQIHASRRRSSWAPPSVSVLQSPRS